MSTAATPKLKLTKEYMVIEPEDIDQLRARLKDQPAYGWEFVQALSHGGKLIAIFSKETIFDQVLVAVPMEGSMGPISDRDRNAFELVTKAVRSNYTDEQLERFHAMAEELRVIVADANHREQEMLSHAVGRR